MLISPHNIKHFLFQFAIVKPTHDIKLLLIIISLIPLILKSGKDKGFENILRVSL